MQEFDPCLWPHFPCITIRDLIFQVDRENNRFLLKDVLTLRYGKRVLVVYNKTKSMLSGMMSRDELHNADG